MQQTIQWDGSTGLRLSRLCARLLLRILTARPPARIMSSEFPIFGNAGDISQFGIFSKHSFKTIFPSCPKFGQVRRIILRLYRYGLGNLGIGLSRRAYHYQTGLTVDCVAALVFYGYRGYRS